MPERGLIGNRRISWKQHNISTQSSPGRGNTYAICRTGSRFRQGWKFGSVFGSVI